MNLFTVTAPNGTTLALVFSAITGLGESERISDGTRRGKVFMGSQTFEVRETLPELVTMYKAAQASVVRW